MWHVHLLKYKRLYLQGMLPRCVSQNAALLFTSLSQPPPCRHRHTALGGVPQHQKCKEISVSFASKNRCWESTWAQRSWLGFFPFLLDFL